MLISEFIDRIAFRLRDTDKRQWTQEYLTQATDAAFAALCTVVPQAYTIHRDIVLDPGTEQTIDADLHRIVHLVGNVCPSTGDMKRAITKVDLSLMDRQHPQWRQDTARSYVWNYMLNALSENKFYVWPPAPVSPAVSIRGQFTKTPFIGMQSDDGINAGGTLNNPGNLGDNINVVPGGYWDTVIMFPDISVFEGHRYIIIDETLAPGGVNLIEEVTAVYLDVLIEYQGVTPTGNVLINSQWQASDYTNGGGFYHFLYEPEEPPNLSPANKIPWSDPRLAEGTVVRLKRNPAGTDGFQLIDTNVYNPGTSQTDIDAYIASTFQVDLPFDTAHIPALEEYALYYCLMRDDEQTGNSNRAMQHWQNFFQLLNKREASEVSVKTGEGESEV